MNITPIQDVGDGYSTFTGSASPSVVDFEFAKKGPADLGALITICTTTDSVYKALSIDASANLSSSWGSFSTKLDFAHTITSSTRTINILVTASKQIGTHTITSVKFKNTFPDAATLYNQGGDSYVSSVAFGGSYMAAYSFTAQDDASYTSLSASVDASISGIVTSFQGHLDTACDDITKSSSVRYTYLQKAVGFADADLPDPKNLESFALSFGKLPLGDQAAIVGFDIRSYGHVAGCPDFKSINHNLKLYLGGVGGHGYAEREVAAKANLPILQYAYDSYFRYNKLPVDWTIATNLAGLKQMIDSIDNWRQAIDEDPTSTSIPPPDISANLDIPTTDVLMEPGPWLGGPIADTTTSDPQSDWVAHNIIPRMLQISYVNNNNQYIQSITRSYQGPDNKDLAGFPRTDGNVGQTDEPLWLTKDNQLTYLSVIWESGRDMDIIWAIETKSTQGAYKLWNRQRDVPGERHKSEWTCPDNATFLGLNVQTKNGCVSALQPVVEGFRACSWGPAAGAGAVGGLEVFRDKHFAGMVGEGELANGREEGSRGHTNRY